jgi:hypothetical protein
MDIFYARMSALIQLGRTFDPDEELGAFPRKLSPSFSFGKLNGLAMSSIAQPSSADRDNEGNHREDVGKGHSRLTLKLSRIAARSWPHGKLFLPCGRRSDAISA